MVEDNCWEFQASVWDAAQQQLQKQQQQKHQQEHSEVNNEGGSEERPRSPLLPDRDEVGESLSQFQFTDHPHPGWEELVDSINTGTGN